MAAASALAQTGADAIVGVWLNQAGEGYIQIYEENNQYFGKIAGAPKDSPRRNESNESLLGKRILENLSYAGDGVWEDGTIYDPDEDKTYSCKLSLEGDDQLKIRGFIGISLLGRTVVWTRAGRDAPGVAQDVLE